MKFGSILFLAALAVSTSASAGEFPSTALLSIGFREARLSDFAETAGFDARAKALNNYVAITADFNGDGKLDEARLLLNGERRIAYVVVAIETAEKLDTYVLESYSLDDIGNIGIRAVDPSAESAAARRSGIAIFDITTGNGEANFFDGEEFAVQLPYKL